MPVFYLDASAIVKRYRAESGTAVVDELLTRPRPTDEFLTSFFSVLEVTAAILRLALSRQLDDFYARQILARFRQDRRDRLGVLPLDNTVVVTAISVVERYRLRSGDAIHLATALN